MNCSQTIGHYYKASLNSESLSNNKIYDGKGLIISREGDILNKYIPEISSYIFDSNSIILLWLETSQATKIFLFMII